MARSDIFFALLQRLDIDTHTHTHTHIHTAYIHSTHNKSYTVVVIVCVYVCCSGRERIRNAIETKSSFFLSEWRGDSFSFYKITIEGGHTHTHTAEEREVGFVCCVVL